MINQIPTFVGLEDAVIAMIGGLSLFFSAVKTESFTAGMGGFRKKFPWGLIFLFGGAWLLRMQ